MNTFRNIILSFLVLLVVIAIIAFSFLIVPTIIVFLFIMGFIAIVVSLFMIIYQEIKYRFDGSEK